MREKARDNGTLERDIPGAFHVRGTEEFDRHIEDEGFVGRPEITVTRLTEEDDVVVAEGSVRTQRKDGTLLDLAMCDVFELKDGKIRRLISYLMEAKRQKDRLHDTVPGCQLRDR